MLLTVRKLDEELHYEALGRFWWQSRYDNMLYPIRLGIKTLVTLKKTDFIITVVKGNSVSDFQPGYICEAKGIVSSVDNTPSGAINFLYQRLFSSKTRFFSLLICSYNNKEINKQILENIPFQPFILTVEKLQIFVGMIRISDHKDLEYAGPGYMSSFIYAIGEQKYKYYLYKKFTNDIVQ
ncbi:7144_t:CDS:2 [Funneliformis mosseae]|uniref:7144_t:CDS:1 n=1 Tax=Funneliformis mosseae TaxID=27381 RepID=A0A9N9BAT2_FUNMO|nr:7144_t:CDS:2 [Funneliformis mosseae]